jgi:hypothetical protein
MTTNAHNDRRTIQAQQADIVGRQSYNQGSFAALDTFINAIEALSMRE